MPFDAAGWQRDTNVGAEAAAIIRDGIDKISAPGTWCKVNYCMTYPDGRAPSYCIMGCVGYLPYIDYKGRGPHDIAIKAMRAEAKARGFGTDRGPQRFNDRSQTTQADALEFLEAAAVRAERDWRIWHG